MRFYNVILSITLTLLSIITLNISEPISPIDNSIKEDNRIKFSRLLNSIASLNKERLVALKKYNDLDKYEYNTGRILRTSGEADPLVAVLFLNKSNPSNNILYEIFDSDLTNEEGDTPVRDVLQKITNYYGIANNVVKENYYFNNKNIVENMLGVKYQMERMDRGREYRKEKESVPMENLTQITKEDDPETDDGEEIVNTPIKPIKPDPNVEKLNYESTRIDKDDSINMNDTQVLRMYKSAKKKAVKKCKKACKAAINQVCGSYKCSSSMKKSFKKYCNSECRTKFDSSC